MQLRRKGEADWGKWKVEAGWEQGSYKVKALREKESGRDGRKK
jgi:hypothetical protein